MEYMSEAYEALIKKLKEDLKDLSAQYEEQTGADNTAIMELLEFIYTHHGEEKTIELAKMIEAKGAVHLTSHVKHLKYMSEETVDE